LKYFSSFNSSINTLHEHFEESLAANLGQLDEVQFVELYLAFI